MIFAIERKSLKNPTNTFLASLASTDLLLILICLPVKVGDYYYYTSVKVGDYYYYTFVKVGDYNYYTSVKVGDYY